MKEMIKRMFAADRPASLEEVLKQLQDAEPGQQVVLPDGFQFIPLCRCNDPNNPIDDHEDADDLDRVPE